MIGRRTEKWLRERGLIPPPPPPPTAAEEAELQRRLDEWRDEWRARPMTPDEIEAETRNLEAAAAAHPEWLIGDVIRLDGRPDIGIADEASMEAYYVDRYGGDYKRWIGQDWEYWDKLARVRERLKSENGRVMPGGRVFMRAWMIEWGLIPLPEPLQGGPGMQAWMMAEKRDPREGYLSGEAVYDPDDVADVDDHYTRRYGPGYARWVGQPARFWNKLARLEEARRRTRKRMGWE